MTKNYTLTKEWQEINLSASDSPLFIRKISDCVIHIAENDNDLDNAIVLKEPITLNLTQDKSIFVKANIDGALVNISNFFF